jgi:hypothetical protein
MMGPPHIFNRLVEALPLVESWVERLLVAHAADAVPVGSLPFRRLGSYVSPQLLARARTASIGLVPFPPVSEYGLPELARIKSGGFAAITFDNVYFVGENPAPESLHLHELVHVTQWATLGRRDFLLTYGVGLVLLGYERSPLEAVAYHIEAEFEAGREVSHLEEDVAGHARMAHREAIDLLRREGLDV